MKFRFLWTLYRAVPGHASKSDHGRFNRGETSIKGYVICRKNFLFANTENGAQSSAILYSILETAKANHLNCYEYLKYVLETLSQIDAPTEEDLDRLLPWSDTLPEKVTTADTEAE